MNGLRSDHKKLIHHGLFRMNAFYKHERLMIFEFEESDNRNIQVGENESRRRGCFALGWERGSGEKNTGKVNVSSKRNTPRHDTVASRALGEERR